MGTELGETAVFTGDPARQIDAFPLWGGDRDVFHPDREEVAPMKMPGP